MRKEKVKQARFHSGNLTDEQFDSRIIAFVVDGVKNDRIEIDSAPEFISSLCKGTYSDITNRIISTAKAIGFEEKKLNSLSLAVDIFWH